MTDVRLAISVAEADKLYAKIVSARDGVRANLDNPTELGFWFGWLDALLTELAECCPDTVKDTAKKRNMKTHPGDAQRHDGLYSYKPRRPIVQQHDGLGGMAGAAGYTQPQRVSGGGDKPK